MNELISESKNDFFYIIGTTILLMLIFIGTYTFMYPSPTVHSSMKPIFPEVVEFDYSHFVDTSAVKQRYLEMSNTYLAEMNSK